MDEESQYSVDSDTDTKFSLEEEEVDSDMDTKFFLKHNEVDNDTDTMFSLKRKRNNNEEEEVHGDTKFSLKDKGNNNQEEEETMENSPMMMMKQFKYLVCLNLLSKEDACVLRAFLSSHPEAHLRDHALSLKTKGFAYGRLADLLRLLGGGHTVLELLDSRGHAISELLHDLRHFSFGGAWLDSLEHSFAHSRSSSCCSSSSSHLLDVSCRSLKELLVSERRLREDVVTLRSKVNSFRLQLERREAELMQLCQNKKAVLEARAALDVPFTF